MAVNAKLGVDLSSFESGIRTGQNILKGLNAEMKAVDAEFKATGNSEQMLTNKTRTLNSQLQAQKGIADQAKQALKAMDDAGVKPTDAAYQKLYATMMNATAGMNETQAALNALDGSQQKAATSANNLATSVNGIGKKISLDQVRSGIDSITTGLENAAKKAIELGEAIWNNVMDSARLADDILTQATLLDMTPERYQQYKGYFDTLGEITITEWAAAKRKIEKVMADPNSQIDVLRALGFTQIVGGKYEGQEIINIADNWEDVFWEIGTELHRRVESGELSNEMADVYGEAIFGKKYSSLKNLIKGGKEAFTEGINTINTASDEALEKDAALNDQIIKLNQSFEALKMEVTSALAPALTDAAKALDSMLGTVLDYLKTEDGQKLLADLGTAISGLFDDLGKIDPEQVVSGITGVLESVTGAVQWLVDNKEGVFEALKWIVFGWAGLNVAGGILDVVKIVGGLADLTGISAAGAAAGSSWASAFASAAMKAAPFLAFIFTLLNPDLAKTSDEVGNSTLLDVTGKLTKEANEYGFTLDSDGNLVINSHKVPKKYTDASEAPTIDMRWSSWTSKTNWRNRFIDALNGKPTTPEDVLDWRPSYMKDQHPQVQVEPVAPADAEESLEAQIGTVEVPAILVFSGYRGLFTGGGGAGGGKYSYLAEHANGLPYVPYDGYLAQLHRGERVLTASENKSYTYNSNNYFGNVNLNNGQDIEALCDSIDRHNRRQRNGYGS